MKNLQVLVWCLVFVCPFFTGCGGKDYGVVESVVVITLDGQPVEGASVTLMAETGDDFGSATTDASGKGRVKTQIEGNQMFGIKPGKYNVSVTKTEATSIPNPDKNSSSEFVTGEVIYHVPKKYNTLSTSGLVAEITAGKSQEVVLELKK